MIALFVGLMCSAAHVVVSLVWLRLPGRMSPVGRHAASALGTHVTVIVLAGQFLEPFAYWPVAAVSGFGAVCWLFAFSAVYKSVSLRILRQLAHTPGHAMPITTITEDYVRPEFEARVALLVKLDCANALGDLYAIAERGSVVARRITLIQRACGIVVSGMYAGDLSRGA